MRSLLLFLCTLSLLYTISGAAASPALKKLTATLQKMLLKKIDEHSLQCTTQKLFDQYCTQNKDPHQIFEEIRNIVMACASTQMYGPGLASKRQTDQCLKSKGSDSDKEGEKAAKGLHQCLGNLITEAKKECGSADKLFSYIDKKFTKAQVQKCITAIKKETGPTWQCFRDNKLVDFQTQKYDV